MPNVEKQRERLISLLKELFQLDQPDLDFGFYRIMHAKAGQVTTFLEEDLLGIIREAFGEADEVRIAECRAAYEAARKQAAEYGAPDPDETEPVKKAKAAWDAAKDSGSNEGDVYDHLYRFFERYYDSGDFMSRRYFARETEGKAAPYAVPYDGREVFLHWANRDQYYIKTSEYLTNFTFDPTQAKEFQAHHGALVQQKPLKVHCRIVSASEGEHNNVQSSEQTERYFIIHEPEPVKIEKGDTGEPELVIQFQYRPDPEKTGQEGTWRKKRLTEAADKVKAQLPTLDGAGNYVTALMTPAPTEAEKDRTMLEKYLAQYTGRNTMDYFIHKDLGGFLRRELDFYIKNEVMRLDDIESADAPRVETYLAKIKVLRRIAQYLIDFLTQLEDFQKRLWLKKKFVVDTQYCITLDHVPEEFYSEIAANKAQREEWIDLFCIDQLAGYTAAITEGFLKENKHLFVDTRLFSWNFKERLISEIEDFSEQQKAILLHSENYQALQLLRPSFERAVQCIYIDPPYNAKSSEILYKNSYKHSSWLSMMESRILASKSLICARGIHISAVDEVEEYRLAFLLEDLFPKHQHTAVSVVHNPSGQQGDNFSYTNDFAIFSYPDKGRSIGMEVREESSDIRNFRDVTGEESLREAGANCFYPIYVKDGKIAGFGEVCKNDYHPSGVNVEGENGVIEVYPIDPQGIERKWRFARQTVDDVRHELFAHYLNNRQVWDIKREKNRFNFKTVWSEAKYSSNNHGSQLLNHMFKRAVFSYPKSLYTVVDCLRAGFSEKKEGWVFDYFAGSGTTGHAVIALNRKDSGSRRFVLAEGESYFDTALRPRILKAFYSPEWRSGSPIERNGQSAIVKYVRLETYEDCLNNLAWKPAPAIGATNHEFARYYMLRYWLNFETKGSPSLLNIEWFDDPTAYTLRIKKPSTDEYVEKAVDLIETFNWLIGLHVEHLDRWRGYDAAFKREVDPELPDDANTRLMLDGALKETDDGTWRFRKVEGYTLRTPGDHKDREKALVVWRKLTGDLEQDNLMLDEWFRKYRLSAQDTEFDVIYVNGSNNLPNLRQAEETWKVRLIEEAFHQAMWDVEG